MEHIGKRVTYVDEVSVEHDALVTNCFGNLGECAVNLVYVSGDKGKHDPYGRQLERASSVSVEGPHTAHGRFYRVP